VRTVFVAALIALIAAAPLACAEATTGTGVVAAVTFGTGEHVNGSGRIVDDRRQLSGFTAVRLAGPIDVELKASDRDAVTVRVDDNIAPLIETRVNGGDRPALEIGVKPGASFRTRHAPVVVVEFRALSELVMRGSGNAHADRISAEDFALSTNGSGDTRIDALQATRFAAVLAGSGDLVVGGRADQLAIRISGSGDADARRLESRDAQVAIAGSGDVALKVSETLDVTIAGSGDVTYWGSPRITQRLRGTGTVHKAH
jgi:hypothetical protein